MRKLSWAVDVVIDMRNAEGVHYFWEIFQHLHICLHRIPAKGIIMIEDMMVLVGNLTPIHRHNGLVCLSSFQSRAIFNQLEAPWSVSILTS